MAQDVQRLSADRTLLLAGVSHDLRTPLSRLRLALEMLGENADATLTQGMIQDVDDMDRKEVTIPSGFACHPSDGGEFLCACPVAIASDIFKSASAKI